MHKIIIVGFTVFFLQIWSNVFSQDRTTSVQFTRNTELLDFIDLGKNGFLIKTGKNYINNSNLDWKISFYSPSIDLKWEAEIDKKQINKGFNDFLVCSKSGKYVYSIEKMGYNISWGFRKFFITQFDQNGNSKSVEIEKPKDAKIIKSIFCNDSFLFIEMADFKNQNQQFLKIRNKNLEQEIVRPFHSKIASYATYIGHNGNIIYYGAKSAGGNVGLYYVIATYNLQKVVSKFSFSANLHSSYIRPGNNLNYHPRGYVTNSFDYDVITINNNITSTKHIPNIGAFGNLKYSAERNKFYAFGISGQGNVKNFKGDFSHIYVYEFDTNGNTTWSLERNIDDLLPTKDRIHTAPFYTYITLNAQNEDRINLYLRQNREIMDFTISNDGKIENTQQFDMLNKLDMDKPPCFLKPQEKSNLYNYLTSLNKNKIKFTRFRIAESPDSEVLLKYNTINYKLEILLFKK